MHILCIGINHQTASVQLRERLAFNDESIKAALSRLACGGIQVDSISEMVILSTCNRVEIYAAAHQSSTGALTSFLSETSNIPASKIHPHLYHCVDGGAVEHLLQVTAGLNSLVLGEAQILGQVTHAFELARGQSTIGPVLSRLFQAAIHAGKRARTETMIGYNAASVSTMAVRLAANAVPDLDHAQVAVMGAGEMAELTVEALRKRGAASITVINRTLERAQQLANRWEGQAATFEMLPQVLEQADIIISSTSAPHTLIHPEMLTPVLEARISRPLVMIDIAVPRDIDPQTGLLPGVVLYDMDSLQAHLEDSMEGRKREVPHVQKILEEEKAEFMQFIAALDVLPLIAEITQQAEAVRQNELEKTLRRMPELSEEERKRIDAMTNALVKKLLHAPLGRLRSKASSPSAASYASLTRALFGLSDFPDQGDQL